MSLPVQQAPSPDKPLCHCPFNTFPLHTSHCVIPWSIGSLSRQATVSLPVQYVPSPDKPLCHCPFNTFPLQTSHCVIARSIRSLSRQATVSLPVQYVPSPDKPLCHSLFTLSAQHMHHVACHVVRRDISAIKFDKVEIAFISALFYCLMPFTDKGGEETGVPGDNP